MRVKSKTQARTPKTASTPSEHDFPALDAWARNLSFDDGHALSVTERRTEALARSVGRPVKPAAKKATRVMISMTPTLKQAARVYARRTGRTLSGLIAESLMEKIKSKAS
jgi:hypothetical protein